MSVIKVKNIFYKGWNSAVEISNIDIKIIIVPETGRILFYGFIDGENLFYENEELEGVNFKKGEYFKKDNIIQAPNVGGNRVLPCSEDYFHLLTGSRHVPDPFINASSYTITFLKNGIVLESPISNILGIQIIRTITISEKGTGVNIEQELVKKQACLRKEIEEIPLTIWSLSKIKTPNISYVPVSKNSCFKKGFTISKWPDAKNNAVENVSVNNNIVALKSSEDLPQKIGSDARNWVAGYLQNTLFVEDFTFENDEKYPDNGTSVTIFGNDLFTELECLSPEKTLKIGESIKYNLNWSLYKIKSTKKINKLLQGL